MSAGRDDASNAATRNTAVSRPSRNTARKAIPARARPDPAISAMSARGSRSALQGRTAWRWIHTIIHADHRNGHEPDDGLELLLLALRELFLGELQRHAAGRAQQHRRDHADPHPPQRPASAHAGARNAATIPTIRAASRPSRKSDDEGGEHLGSAPPGSGVVGAPLLG